MKKLLLLLIIPLLSFGQEKEYNIENLDILQYDSFNNYIRTISHFEFFASMLVPATTIFNLSDYMSYFRTPIPNQFESLSIDLNYPRKYHVDLLKYVFVNKSSAQPVTGNLFFEPETRFDFLFEKKKNILGYVKNGKMNGSWFVPTAVLTTSMHKDGLPSSWTMFADTHIGLIVLSYKDGIRHGETKAFNESGEVYYKCNYINGQLDGVEILDITCIENVYSLAEGIGSWGLSNTFSYTEPNNISDVPKQIKKYKKGELVQMKLWVYDFLKSKNCYDSMGLKDLIKPDPYTQKKPKNLKELLKIKKLHTEQLDSFKNCVNIQLVLDWDIDSEKNLDFLILELIRNNYLSNKKP